MRAAGSPAVALEPADLEPVGPRDGASRWVPAGSSDAASPVDGVTDGGTASWPRECRDGGGGRIQPEWMPTQVPAAGRQTSEYYSSVCPGGVWRRPRECFDPGAYALGRQDSACSSWAARIAESRRGTARGRCGGGAQIHRCASCRRQCGSGTDTASRVVGGMLWAPRPVQGGAAGGRRAGCNVCRAPARAPR